MRRSAGGVPPPPPPHPAPRREVVDTRVLTKPSSFSGEQDGKISFATWSFRMVTYGTALSTKLGELMSAAAALANGETELTTMI